MQTLLLKVELASFLRRLNSGMAEMGTIMSLSSSNMWTALWGKLGGGDLCFMVTSIGKVIVVEALELHCFSVNKQYRVHGLHCYGPGLCISTTNHK